MADAKTQFERLNNFNWASWKFRMELLLLREGLQDIVSKPKPAKLPFDWTIRDGKARAAIGLALENDQLCHVMAATTAYEMWQALKNYHERGSLTNKVYVFRKLCSLQLEDGGNMAEHLMGVAELVHRLEALGEGLREHWIVAIILSSLPGSYDALITALESRPVEELNQDYVKGKLLDEWKRRCEKAETEKALKVTGNTHRESRDSAHHRSGRSEGKTWRCYCCKKRGHFWRDCPKLSISDDDDDDEQEEEVRMSMKRNTTNAVCFNAVGRGESYKGEKQPKDDVWCLDSGCTMHLTGKAELLEGLMACKEEIVLADGRKVLATARGTGRLKITGEKGERQVIPISNVLFVPGLAGNLLSVGRIVARGFEVRFGLKECVVQKGGSLIAKAERSNGLFVIR